MASKKYYWLKLQRDFFKRHDIRIIEAMPNGKDYILFYLKLLVESIDHDGELRFSDTIPYNDEMLSTITNTNIDVVRSAMKIFTELQMIEVLEDSTIFMSEVEKMIGFETDWAKKKREYRLKQEDNVRTIEDNVRQEKEKEKEKDIENILCANDVFEELWKLYPNKKGKGQISDAKKKKLSLIGLDEMKRCIERYLKDLEKDPWRKPQNGSTFFNSGYVDYLDGNYGSEPVKVVIEEPEEVMDLWGDD